MALDLTTPSAFDRLLATLRQIIRNEVPQLTYAGKWDYTITGVNASDNTLNLDPGIDTTIPLGSLQHVPVRSSTSGETLIIPPTAVGNHCLVEFVNMDPSRPVVTSIDPYELAAPSLIAGAIGRVGDQVIAGPFAGTIISGSGSVSK